MKVNGCVSVLGGHKGNRKSSKAQPPSPHLVPRRVVLCANHHTKSSSSLGIRHRPPRVGCLARVTQPIVGLLESLAVLGCRCNSSHALKRSDCQGVPAIATACLRVQVSTSAATSTARTAGCDLPQTQQAQHLHQQQQQDVAAAVESEPEEYGHSSSNTPGSSAALLQALENTHAWNKPKHHSLAHGHVHTCKVSNRAEERRCVTEGLCDGQLPLKHLNRARCVAARLQSNTCGQAHSVSCRCSERSIVTLLAFRCSSCKHTSSYDERNRDATQTLELEEREGYLGKRPGKDGELKCGSPGVQRQGYRK
jgi:hypothetical protein